MLLKFLSSSSAVFSTAIIFRVILIAWSVYQDNNSAVKYTDIDYFVFTDASAFVASGKSPYDRETYRYTPLLAWLLVPTVKWFEFGKALFAAADILAGWFLLRVLRDQYGIDPKRAVRYSAIWLLNPMVAGISTRGSSEGLLGVLAVALVLATMQKRVTLAGFILGFSVHFKIYPFIYGPTLFWWLEPEDIFVASTLKEKILIFFSRERRMLISSSILTFSVSNLIMYKIYGNEYLEHSWLYHFTRTDHRMNFSVYNTLLHLASSPSYSGSYQLAKLSFIPQIFLSAVAIPLVLAKKDLSGAMLCQTLAFVTLNKVCTSQYFLWYLIFLPLYLPNSKLIHRPIAGFLILVSWVAGQAFWLYEGYQLEFLGLSVFVPGLFYAGLTFFVVNIGILSWFINDVSSIDQRTTSRHVQKHKKL